MLNADALQVFPYRYETEFASLVRTVSSLLRSSSPSVSLAAAEMLLALVAAADPPTGVTRVHALHMVARSGSVLNIVAVLSSDVQDITPTVVACMRLLRTASRDATISEQILSSDHVGTLLDQLKLPLGDPVLSLTVETLWNLLETNQQEAAALMAVVPFVTLLAQVLQRALEPGVRESDKEMRNELIVLGTLLVLGSETAGMEALAQGGLVRQVLSLVTTEAMHGVEEHSPLFPATPINLELLQLSLNFLQVLTADETPELVKTHLIREQLPAVLMAMLCIEPEVVPVMMRWGGAQQAELRVTCMALLCNLVGLVPEQLPAAGLASAVLPHLREAGAQHPELREAGLRVLTHAMQADAGIGALQHALGEAGALPLLLDIVGSADRLASPPPATTALAIPLGLSAKALQDALLLISLLCTAHVPHQDAFGEHGGVSVVLSLLSSRTATRLLLSAVDCLWSAVAPHAANVCRLVARQGVHALFDCLEACPFAPRAQLLSYTADLLEDPAAAEQANEWRSKGGAPALKLLLRLWSEEEVRLGAASGSSGLLCSTKRPLSVASQQLLEGFSTSLHIERDSDNELDDEDLEEERMAMIRELSMGGDEVLAAAAQAIDGVTSGLKLNTAAGLSAGGRFDGMNSAEAAAVQGQDLRAKCFAVLKQIGFASSEPLTTKQQLQIEAVRRYQTFCEAETWHDLEDELASEGCRPVSADAAALDTVCDATQTVASGVLEAQVQLSAQIANGEAVTEREMLSRVRVLRDGPMGELQTTTTKGVSLFRKRLEAKACIGDMVASSKIGYEGPMPNAAEYVEAKLEELEELRGCRPTVLSDVPRMLQSLAGVAGVPKERVDAFLDDSGLQRELAAPQKMDVSVLAHEGSDGKPASAVIDFAPGPLPAHTLVSEEKQRELMLEFLGYAGIR